MGRQLPGVMVGSKHQRSNLSQHAIVTLGERGQDTTWYFKHLKRPAVERQAVTRCSRFTLYLLDGEWAWTLQSEASKTPWDKYREYTRLQKPVETPCYYCGSCKKRWPNYDDAVAHLGNDR